MLSQSFVNISEHDTCVNLVRHKIEDNAQQVYFFAFICHYFHSVINALKDENLLQAYMKICISWMQVYVATFLYIFYNTF